MQTILGAGGAIGTLLARELVPYTNAIRLVSRNPEKVNPGDEIFAADITDPEAVEKAIEGSKVVYLTAGFEYKTKTWQETWPLVMTSVINGCKKHRSRLVFFDNAYSYDPRYLSNLTEETPLNPPSKKGKVRMQIAQQLLQETENGNLTAMIVRAADFYGPKVNTSIMMETVYKRLKAGKKPMWMGNAKCIHSMTFTPDAAKATALLGNKPDAFQQVWHLPTSTEKISGKAWIGLFANAMHKEPAFSATPGWIIKTIGLLNPFFKELGEMMYQFENDYYFNSDKFRQHFPDFKITEAKEGVEAVVNS